LHPIKLKNQKKREQQIIFQVMHIGERIKQVLEERHRPVTWLAKEIQCERTNVYNIFSRKDISTGLLQKISIILNHDFFKELSQDTFKKK
jgi:hypothetical protein